jgi:hypothetical protein
LFDRDGVPLSVAPANLTQQAKIFEMARVLRLLTPPCLHELTGNNFGCFNNFTLLDTVRRRYLEENGGGEFFAKQGRVLNIAFFANDDGDAFQEAFFFNFSPKGAQLSDFCPEGRVSFKKLYEVEKCLRYLQSFWTMVYQGEDSEGPLQVETVLQALLTRLDTSVILQTLSAEYVGAVIDQALRSLAAALDKALPPGTLRTPRQWWSIIQKRMDTLVFSKENQDLFELSKTRLGVTKDRGGLNKDISPHKPGGSVVTPVKSSTGGTGGGEEVCFSALRHHFQSPPGAAPCDAGAACTRLHPDKYKTVTSAQVVTSLLKGKGDNLDLMRTVVAESQSFRS